MDAQRAKHRNRLANEKSPYLLQHQHNPVDWFPWGLEAFEKARRENKPIFLSVGYSTCHWCHVMERESFESERVAEALNRSFVPIKVDREERPDVDRIYMNFVQATSGHGGWPLNVFLTPDLKPFFGGTYWPPENRHGRAGILEVLEQVSEVWRTRKGEIVQSADSIHHQILSAAASAAGDAGSPPGMDILEKAARLFKSTYDPQHGGFGSAPKFPQPSVPLFLLRHARRTGDNEAAQMVLNTCDRMAAGGIYDHLGGGFARYSVDAEWLVPHFEKMLYDNAQLTHLYLDAHVISGETRYAEVARGTLDYILRDMTHPEGGFYSAEDADSEGHEGKFYCWTKDEIERLLNPEEAGIINRHFGITTQGNFVDHSHPAPLAGQNVLSIQDAHIGSHDQLALETARKKMIQARAQRVRPHLDDKVLASWNGLMLGAMARAGAVLNDEDYLEAAAHNAAFIRTRLWEDGRLYHRWRDGERDNVELLEGYAFVLDGLLHLYEATLDPAALEFGIQVADGMLQRFHDPVQGAFWQTAPDNHLIMRLKPDYDGAEPSGNSVAALALFRLARVTDQVRFQDAATGTLRFFSARLAQVPHAMPNMLHALEYQNTEPSQVIVAGDVSSARGRELVRAAHRAYMPNKVILGTEGPVQGFAQSLRSSGPPRAFLCSGAECKAPVSSGPALLTAIKEQVGAKTG